MTIARIQLNGSDLDVSVVRRRTERLGTRFEAKNGAIRFALRAVRTTWEVEARDIPIAQVLLLRSLYTSAAPLTLRDEYAVSYPVLVADDPLEETTATLVGDNQTVYYDVTLTLIEVLG